MGVGDRAHFICATDAARRMRIALSIEYDGSGFCGWQKQPAGGSLQDAVDAALSTMAGHPVQSHCAGRTDAGVHALSQIIHFDTTAQRPLTAWVRGVNALLPWTISVQWARVVADAFHARNRATARAYTYLLLNRPQRPGVHHGRVGWYHRPLDVERMEQATRHLLGRHDFSAFRAAQCQAMSPVKQIHRAHVERHGDLVLFEFRADAFLQHMVRNLVGCLISIGDGTQPPEWLHNVIESCDRTQASATFSPNGLYLTAVEYDPVWGLPTAPQRLPSDAFLSASLNNIVFS